MDYRYDAFISYRHCELDKFVAENLHKMLETYKPPKFVKKNGTRSKIKRVFRDQEELPLTSNLEDPIIKALEQSEFLIVICSPRLKDSVWCRKEIETFIKMHGRDRVLAVLIEGEPNESFPEEITKGEAVTQYVNGIQTITYENYEPLAADFRGKDKKAVKKAMKTEVLRLMAPIFGVNFDDLRQRHKERKIKSFIEIAITITCIALLFGAYCGYTAFKIKKQNVEITEKSKKIEEQSYEISRQTAEIKSQYDELCLSQAKSLATQALTNYDVDDRLGAIETSIHALTKYNKVDMPYTPEAQLALTMSSRIYNGEFENAPVANFEMPSIVSDFKVSDDGNFILSIDKNNNIVLFGTSTFERIYIKNVEHDLNSEKQFGFLNNDIFYFEDYEDLCYSIFFVSTKTGEVLNTIKKDLIVSSEFDISKDNNIFAVDLGNSIGFYDATSFDLICDYEIPELGIVDSINFIGDTKVLLMIDENLSGIYKSINEINCVLFDVDKKSVIHESIYKYTNFCDLTYDDEYIYMATYDYNITKIDSTLRCIDINTGEIVWEHIENGYSIDSLYLYNGYLFSNTERMGKIYVAKNGEMLINVPFKEDVVSTYGNNDTLIIMESDGTWGLINLNSISFTELAMMNCTKLSKIINSSSGIYGVPKDSRMICIYSKITNSDRKEFDGELKKREELKSIYKSNEVYDEILNLIKINNASMISNIYDSEELGMYIVVYFDGEYEMYSKSDYSLQGKFECNIPFPIGDYFGQDINGNYYFSYWVLNSDFELIENITHFEGISADGKYIVQYDYQGDSKFLTSLPIYSIDEIIEYGKAVLAEYKH